MRIIGLSVDNVKRIKAVSIEDPKADVQVIGGRNRQGKSSLLDAIWLALGGGTAAKAVDEPIRSGEKKASVVITVGDDGEAQFTVERRWTTKGTSLKVTAADGQRYDSPQALLNELVGQLTFDPVRFVESDAKAQRQTLLDTLGLTAKVTRLNEQRAEVFQERTAVNRAVKELGAEVKGYKDLPTSLPKDTGETTEQLLDSLRRQQQAQQTYDRVQEQAVQLEHKIEQMERTLSEAKQAIQSHKDWLFANERPDTTELEQRISQASELAGLRAKVQARDAAAKRYADRKARSQALTEQIESFDEQKLKLLTDIQLPVTGLQVTDDGVLYNGVPLSQASGAERITVGMAVALASKPRLRVVLIRDGSLLDDESMELLRKFADDNDVQVWIERVGSNDADALIIEDGEVQE
jgi:DNA repair exonuclease SbcCD ATPase subunit